MYCVQIIAKRVVLILSWITLNFYNNYPIQFIKWSVYPTNWFILYNNVECTVADVAAGFPSLWYFPKQAWHDTCPTGVKRLLLLHTQSVNLMTNIGLILCLSIKQSTLSFFANRSYMQVLLGVFLNIELANWWPSLRGHLSKRCQGDLLVLSCPPLQLTPEFSWCHWPPKQRWHLQPPSSIESC